METPTLETPTDEFQQIIDQLADCDQAVVQRLEGLYALVRVSVHRWRGRHQIKQAEVIVGGDNLAKRPIVSKPYWHLEPPEWKAKFDAIELQKEEILRIYSKPSRQLAGVRIVMADRLEECCARLKALEDVFMSTAEEFTNKENYPKILEYAKEQLGEGSSGLNDAEKHIPPLTAMRKRYRMERFVIPTSLPDWAVEGDDFHSQELRKTGRKFLTENLVTLAQQPREELAGCIWSDDPDSPALVNQLVIGRDAEKKWIPKPKRRVSRDSITSFLTTLSNFTNFEEAVDAETLRVAKVIEVDLKSLHDEMELEVAKGRRISLNSDDSLAVAYATQLMALYTQLTKPGAMVEGLRKFCKNAGVDV